MTPKKRVERPKGIVVTVRRRLFQENSWAAQGRKGENEFVQYWAGSSMGAGLHMNACYEQMRKAGLPAIRFGQSIRVRVTIAPEEKKRP